MVKEKDTKQKKSHQPLNVEQLLFQLKLLLLDNANATHLALPRPHRFDVCVSAHGSNHWQIFPLNHFRTVRYHYCLGSLAW